MMRKGPLGNLDGHLSGVLLGVVTVLIVADLVLTRVAPRLASPLAPVVLGLFFVATMLGVSAATRREAHLSLGLLSRVVPSRWGRMLRGVALGATVAFFAALMVAGAQVCWGQVRWDNRALLSWCPDWVIMLAVPVAAALSCVGAVRAWRARSESGGDVRDRAHNE